jgi:F0F1-type ATP synthase membrane subunit b/b'
MLMFNENIRVRNTAHNINILTVPEYQEIYFDVFEVEVNGCKYIAEKIDDYKGSPVVNIPLVIEGKEYTAPFVLNQGKFDVLFNKYNSTYVKDVTEIEEEVSIDVPELDVVDEIIFEKRDSILDDINQAKLCAQDYLDKLKQRRIEETNEHHQKKLEDFNTELSDIKQGLLEEFLQVANSVKQEINSVNDKANDKLTDFIASKVNQLTETLNDKVNDKAVNLEKYLRDKVDEMATGIITGVLATELNKGQSEVTAFATESFEKINTKLVSLVNEYQSKTEESLKDTLSQVDERVLSVEKANVELRDNIVTNNNKSLSRIGQLKSQIDNTLVKIDEVKIQVDDTINEATESIKAFYNEKIDIVSKSIDVIDREGRDNKALCLRLINDSKDYLLQTIKDLKVEVPNIVIEGKDGLGKEIDVKSIRAELEKSITARFNLELSSLRRMMEMMSGGGTNGGGGGSSNPFANGGTMNGNLTVTGYVSAGSLYVNNNSVIGGSLTVYGLLSANTFNVGTLTSNNLNVSTLSAGNLSAYNLYVANDGIIGDDLTVGDSLTVGGTVSASNANITNNLTLGGSISAGSVYILGDSGYEKVASEDFIIAMAIALG